jgi:hypothetical protein
LPVAAVQYQSAIGQDANAQEAAQARNNVGVLFLSLNNLPVAKGEFDEGNSLMML